MSFKSFLTNLEIRKKINYVTSDEIFKNNYREIVLCLSHIHNFFSVMCMNMNGRTTRNEFQALMEIKTISILV